MVETVYTGLMQATEIARQSDLRQSSNGVRYTSFGENNLEAADLDRIVQAVPAAIAGALGRKAYYFVPLAMAERPVEVRESSIVEAVNIEGSAPATALDLFPDATEATPARPSMRPHADDTLIATRFTTELSDRAICHRNIALGAIDGVFISTRLLADRFALAFEFFINVGHAFVDTAGIPQAFIDLVWAQALGDVRGETSLDAWEGRTVALTKDPADPLARRIDEKAKSEFLEAAFSDALAIYQLSLAIDFDYAELRERDYPLLAPAALADRLRLVAKLFPPNAGYEFAIRYRRRK
jgi:hypothetical protein